VSLTSLSQIVRFLRANPYPKVTDLSCRLPLLTLSHKLEAANLGDLMRLLVRSIEEMIKKNWLSQRSFTLSQISNFSSSLSPWFSWIVISVSDRSTKCEQLFASRSCISPANLFTMHKRFRVTRNRKERGKLLFSLSPPSHMTPCTLRYFVKCTTCYSATTTISPPLSQYDVMLTSMQFKRFHSTVNKKRKLFPTLTPTSQGLSCVATHSPHTPQLSFESHGGVFLILQSVQEY